MNSIVIANENVLADRALWSDGACVIYPEEIAAYKADLAPKNSPFQRKLQYYHTSYVVFNWKRIIANKYY